MKFACCPECKQKLIEDETFESSIDPYETREFLCGHCPECNKYFTWQNVYVYSHYSELEEVSEEVD